MQLLGSVSEKCMCVEFLCIEFLSGWSLAKHQIFPNTQT
jgi:hypothetical protein